MVKTHPEIGVGIKAMRTGHRVLFATATEGSPACKPPLILAVSSTSSLARLRHYWLLIIDRGRLHPVRAGRRETTLQAHVARYEQASLILTSNLPFDRWRNVFGERALAAAMIDRIVRHTEVVSLEGASHRLRNSSIDTLPSARAANTSQ